MAHAVPVMIRVSVARRKHLFDMRIPFRKRPQHPYKGMEPQVGEEKMAVMAGADGATRPFFGAGSRHDRRSK